MTRFAIALALLLAGCQVYNSSSGDKLRYGDSNDVEASSRGFLQWKCSQCHDFASASTTDLISQGLIKAGSPETSPLFTRIRGAGAGGKENMPPNNADNGPDVDQYSLATLEEWIRGL